MNEQTKYERQNQTLAVIGIGTIAVTAALVFVVIEAALVFATIEAAAIPFLVSACVVGFPVALASYLIRYFPE